MCTLNFEIKCNNKDSSSKQLTKAKNDDGIMPHSETVYLASTSIYYIVIPILKTTKLIQSLIMWVMFSMSIAICPVVAIYIN